MTVSRKGIIMEYKDINKIARRFLRKIGGKPDVTAIIGYIESLGYDVYFTDTAQATAIIKSLQFDVDAVSNRKAFTFSRPIRAIFINGKLSENDKLVALLHEVGHIVLGHLDATTHIVKDDENAEAEAQTFANLVASGEIETHKRYGTVVTTVAVLCLVTVAATAAIMVRHYKTLPTDSKHAVEGVQNINTDGDTVVKTPEYVSGEPESDNVYITPTGKAYHSGDCIYAKKSGFEISRKEAEKHYKPCSYCHP